MSTLPSPGQLGPEDAAALLRRAERSTRDAQGNAGWPSAVFLVLFMRRAKRGFGLRWTVSIGTWGVLWALGTLAGPALPWVALASAVGIVVCTAGGALWELSR